MAKPGRKPGNKYLRRRGAAPGPLTPHGQTSGIGHQEAMGTMMRHERQQKAVRFLIDQQLTYEQIGRQLGVTAKTICLDLQAALAEMKAETFETLAQRRQIETRRLDRNDRAVLPLLYGAIKSDDPVKIAHVQVRAHERLTASGERRAKLWGLDAPTKVTATDISGTKPYGELTDADLETELRTLTLAAGLDYKMESEPGGGNGDGQ